MRVLVRRLRGRPWLSALVVLVVPTRVTVGAVGSERTQISSGLKAGEQVVLADLAEPLPTSG